MADKLIYLYLILLPLMDLPRSAFMGTRVQYADLVFIPILFLYLIRLFQGRIRLSIEKTDVFLSLFLFIAFLSFLYSWTREESLIQLSGLFYLAVVYFVFKNLIKNKTIFRKLNLLLFGLVVFVSGWGLACIFLYKLFNIKWASDFIFLGYNESAVVSSVRVSSFLRSPDMFLGFLLLGLGGSFVAQDFLQERYKKFSRVAIGSIIISAIFTFSRSLVGIFLFLMLLAFRFKKRNHWLSCLCISVLTAIIIFAVITSTFRIYPVSITQDPDRGRVNFSFNSQPDGRVYLAKAAFRIIRSHPLLGIGIGAFPLHFAKFLNAAEIKGIMQIPDLSSLIVAPHSLYLGTASQMGLLGFILLLVFFGQFMLRLTKRGKYPYIYLAAICGFLANGFFVDILSMRSLWVLLALAAIPYEDFTDSSTLK